MALAAKRELYSVEDLENWSGEPPVLAVIGDPIAHSRSPQLHTPALRSRGLAGDYIRVHVRPGDAGRAFRAMEALGMTGCNVTIPHKAEALREMSEVTREAQLIGSVNTVHILEGERKGSNSDAPGFQMALEEIAGRPLKDFRVAIFGAGGGAGRAAAVRCAMEGCPEVRLLNRTRSKAEELAERLAAEGATGKIRVPEWADDEVKNALAECDLVVNGTSVGMKDDDEPLFDYGLLTPAHVVFEMVYRNGGTPLERAAVRCVNGLDMLLHQGVISFRTWFGDPVPVALMRGGLGMPPR